MKKTVFLCVFYLFSCSSLFAQNIAGFWKSISEKTGKPQCVVAVYEYKGDYYGRIIGTYDENGKIEETIYAPKNRAPGVEGHPFYCGLDLIWNLHNKGGDRYKGKIIDPEKGRIYNAELWVKNGNLVVRGEILFFGRNQEWLPFTDKDFPSNFKKPDVSKFVPVVPKVD